MVFLMVLFMIRVYQSKGLYYSPHIFTIPCWFDISIISTKVLLPFLKSNSYFLRQTKTFITIFRCTLCYLSPIIASLVWLNAIFLFFILDWKNFAEVNLNSKLVFHYDTWLCSLSLSLSLSCSYWSITSNQLQKCFLDYFRNSNNARNKYQYLLHKQKNIKVLHILWLFVVSCCREWVVRNSQAVWMHFFSRKF